jgi:hypothetical protein
MNCSFVPLGAPDNNKTLLYISINEYINTINKIMINKNLDLLEAKNLGRIFMETVEIYNDINAHFYELGDTDEKLSECKKNIYDFLIKIRERLLIEFNIDLLVLSKYEVLNSLVQRLCHKCSLDKSVISLYEDFSKYLMIERSNLESLLVKEHL